MFFQTFSNFHKTNEKALYTGNVILAAVHVYDL